MLQPFFTEQCIGYFNTKVGLVAANIFCIQNEEFKWENKDVLIKKDITLNPTILTKVDRNLQKIAKILEDKDVSGTETEKEILKYQFLLIIGFLLQGFLLL